MGRRKQEHEDDIGQPVLAEISGAYAELERSITRILKRFTKLPPEEVESFRAQLRSAREIAQSPALFLLRERPPAPDEELED